MTGGSRSVDEKSLHQFHLGFHCFIFTCNCIFLCLSSTSLSLSLPRLFSSSVTHPRLLPPHPSALLLVWNKRLKSKTRTILISSTHKQLHTQRPTHTCTLIFKAAWSLLEVSSQWHKCYVCQMHTHTLQAIAFLFACTVTLWQHSGVPSQEILCKKFFPKQIKTHVHQKCIWDKLQSCRTAKNPCHAMQPCPDPFKIFGLHLSSIFPIC